MKCENLICAEKHNQVATRPENWLKTCGTGRFGIWKKIACELWSAQNSPTSQKDLRLSLDAVASGLHHLVHGVRREGALCAQLWVRGVRGSKIGKILQIFNELVLGCIKTKFCKKICVWQHFSSSTRFASFCTAASSKFSQKIGLKNCEFRKISEFFLQNFANVGK